MTTSAYSLYATSLSSLKARQMEMETTANNVANQNTIAYKRNRVAFKTYLSSEEMVEPGQKTPQGIEVAATQRLFEQGPIQPTGVPWDIAIHGDGFFAVSLVGGGVAYTRDGAFRPDADGRLATIQGHLLLPPITVPEGTQEIYITPPGEVIALVEGEPQALGNLQLAHFTNPMGLQTMGDNLYIATPASGPAQMNAPGTDGLGQLISQSLEMSNVDTGQEMVDLILAQRAYSVSLRVLLITDQMVARMTNMQG